MRLTVHSEPRHGARQHLVLAVLVCVALVALLVVGAGACGSSSSEPSPSPSPSNDTVAVPDLETDHVTKADAEMELEEAGLEAVVQTEASAEVPAGSVVRQSPAPGAEVEKGSSVIIAVSMGPKMVALPDLTGMKKKQVESFLHAHKLTGDEVEGETEKVAEGRCYKQSPGPGDQAPQGSTVTYWISSGKPMVKVPDLIGMTPKAAQQVLTEKTLVYGGSSKKYSSKIEKGKVMAQSVPAGAAVAKGTDVAIIVSKGKAETTLTVPKCVGKTQKEMVPKLRQAGFQDILIDTVSSTEATGTIVGQSPPAGTKIHASQRVTLEVSKGGGTLIKVPDCVGKNAKTYVSKLEDMGFKNVQTKKKDSTKPEGRILQQAPKAGAKVHPNDPLVLFVSSGLYD